MTDFAKEHPKKEESSEKQMMLGGIWVQSPCEDKAACLNRFEEIQKSALTIIRQFKQDRQNILKDFDMWLLPIAKEVLEELTQNAEELNGHLQETLKSLDTVSQTDWLQHAKQWASLYAKWYDPKHFTQKVLQLASKKAKQLIDKDIKVIHDYQTQSLTHLSSEESQYIKSRLKAATAKSLKALQQLKQTPDELSLKQASAWMARLHRERETHFDELLMRIDQIIKEVGEPEHPLFGGGEFFELEGEIKFTEHELTHLTRLWRGLRVRTAEEKEFIVMRLDELEEHLEQFDFSHMPKELKERFDDIDRRIHEMRTEIEFGQ